MTQSSAERDAAAGESAGSGHSCDPGMTCSPAADRKRHYKYYLAGAVSLFTFAVYLSALRNGFVNWDDTYYVVVNSHIRSFNLHFLRWAFFDFYAGNWHPLTWISHALDYAIWGLNPLGHHLTSDIIHAVNTFVVVLLAARLVALRTAAKTADGLSRFPGGKAALVAGAVTGLLFGIHPLHVESVAWVSERKDLLCALFFLLSLSSYLKYASHTVENPLQGRARSFYSDKNYLLALGFFVLALLSKPMAVTLPAILLILDWYPLERILSRRALRNAIVEKLPFIALALASSVVTILAQRSSGAVGNAPLSVRVFVAFGSLIAYLWKMIAPVNLLPFYPFPGPATFSAANYYPAVALVIGISAACLFYARKRKILLALWSYYVITLLPVLGLVEVGRQSMADRYTYLPSLAPFLLVGLGAAWVSENADALKQGEKAVKAISVAAALVVFVALSYMTFKQIGIWKDGLSLWNWQIEKEPEPVSLSYINRGIMLSTRKGRLDDAIADFSRAIALNPSSYEAYRELAQAYLKKGETAKAISDFEKAIALMPTFNREYTDPTYIGTHIRPLIDTHVTLGVLYGGIGSFDKSIEHLTKAIRLDPGYAIAYNDRGYTYFLSGYYDKALRDFDRAIELNPRNANAYLNRGNVYLKTGKIEQAMSDFRKACDMKNEGGCNALRGLQKDTNGRGK